jgi:rRNA-processing protein FCF1
MDRTCLEELKEVRRKEIKDFMHADINHMKKHKLHIDTVRAMNHIIREYTPSIIGTVMEELKAVRNKQRVQGYQKNQQHRKEQRKRTKTVKAMDSIIYELEVLGVK